MTKSDTFDPFLASPQLPEIRALFQAIAAGKRRPDLWGMLNKITQKLSAQDRERLNDLFAAELEKR